MDWIEGLLNFILSIDWNGVLLDFILSLISAAFFWIISFKYSRTKIIFSKQLIKSDAIKPGGYRIKIANVGKRDLIEITVIAKLKIKINNSTQVFFLIFLTLKRKMVL